MAVSALLGIKLSDVEIARAVLNAGVYDWRAITLVSIALAESGGYEGAIRLNPGTEANGFLPSLDVGLWQISTRWQPQVSVTTSLQAGPAAIEAVRISGAKTWQYSWKPWHSYTAGKTAQFTGRSRIAVNTVRVELGLPII